MSARTETFCDFPIDGQPCGRKAQTPFEAWLGDAVLTADYCAKHVGAATAGLGGLGVAPRFTRTGRKQRKAYLGRSGRPFSNYEARQWLNAQGYAVGPGPGRLSAEHLDIYARAH